MLCMPDVRGCVVVPVVWQPGNVGARGSQSLRNHWAELAIGTLLSRGAPSRVRASLQLSRTHPPHPMSVRVSVTRTSCRCQGLQAPGTVALHGSDVQAAALTCSSSYVHAAVSACTHASAVRLHRGVITSKPCYSQTREAYSPRLLLLLSSSVFFSFFPLSSSLPFSLLSSSSLFSLLLLPSSPPLLLSPLSFFFFFSRPLSPSRGPALGSGSSCLSRHGVFRSILTHGLGF